MGRSTLASASDYYPSGHPIELPEHTVTLDTFALDKYEITVGRFRRFVAVYDGSPPPAGAGTHASISGTGWQSAWNGALASTSVELIAGLKCSSSYQMWTDAVGANESKPLNCLDWYTAFAFCIWDGARLATEAEWEYAAVNGNENRLYPWGGSAPDATYASYFCLGDGLASCLASDILSVGSKPNGAGRWGQHDLAGNLGEWTFDGFTSSYYSTSPASNPANTSTANRVVRGGSFNYDASLIRAASRDAFPPATHDYAYGARCAKNP
jgi:formylglycine-generating enzyme